MAPSSGKKAPLHHDSSDVDFAGEGSPSLAGGSTKARLHQPVHLGLASAVNAAANGSVDGGGGRGGARPSNYKEIMPGLSVAGGGAARPASHGGGGGGQPVYRARHRGPMRLSDLPEPSLNRGVSDEATDWNVLQSSGRRHHKGTKLGLGIGAGKAVDAVGGAAKGLLQGLTGGLLGGAKPPHAPRH